MSVHFVLGIALGRRFTDGAVRFLCRRKLQWPPNFRCLLSPDHLFSFKSYFLSSQGSRSSLILSNYSPFIENCEKIAHQICINQITFFFCSTRGSYIWRGNVVIFLQTHAESAKKFVILALIEQKNLFYSRIPSLFFMWQASPVSNLNWPFSFVIYREWAYNNKSIIRPK